MKRRKVGKYFTERDERYLDRPDGSLMALFCEHWSRDTDPAGMAAEAAAWLRSRWLPDRATARSLCEHLRSDHGVPHDSPEDFAARTIELVGYLEVIESRGKDWFNAEVPGEVGVHPSLERVRTKYWFTVGVAVELGKLHALFHIYAEEDRRRKKDRQPKRLAWADAVADKLVGKGTSDRERWALITEDFEVFADGRRWYARREEDEKGTERLWAYDADDERAAHQRGPTYRAFVDGYLAPARKRRKASLPEKGK